MADYTTKMIKPDIGSVSGIIYELLQPGTIISSKDKTGINISEIVITSSGDRINKHPDCVAFGANEAYTGIPPEGKTCMFCKKQSAIHSVKKMVSSEGQYAGWHYCVDCKTKY